jgi:predicted RNA-binding protein with RPS1 domain
MDQSSSSTANTPGTPGTPAPSTDAIGAEMQQEMDAAMSAAVAAPQEAPRHKKPDVQHLPGGAPIRGPRVVQSGREHRTGRVVSVGPDDIFIEFGPKELGVVTRIQFKEEELPKVGDNLEVVVDRFEKDENLFLCSRPGQVTKADWELLEPGQIVDAMCTGVNKGGLELEVAKHRAFMPKGQVDVHFIEDLTPFVGQKITCKVTKVDRSGGGNITLSRKEIVAAERREKVKKLKETLAEGDVLEGVVKKVMPFGAFIDVGGMDMLCHVSDLSFDRVVKPEDVVKEGQTVRVKVLKLDWETERHAVGMRQLMDDPFVVALKDIAEGSIVQGTVTKLAEFGAFIQIAEGIEGLCHISELAWKRVGKTSDVLQPKQVVSVKVLKLDPDSRKISLSIKQTQAAPEAERAPGAPAGAGGPGGGGGGGRGGPGGGGRGGFGGGGGGRGGRGGFEVDTRTPEEILKETPAERRKREAAAAKLKETGLKSGLGKNASLGMSLADLKL